MQANLIPILVAIIFILIAYVVLLLYLNSYLSRQTALSPIPATAYGQDMGENRGFTECTLVHTRAGTSHVFFDADQWLSEPKNLAYATSWLTKTILKIQSKAHAQGFELNGLAFIEKDSGPTGLITLQHLIAERTGMKSCAIRLRRWPFLPQAAIKGEPPAKGSKWILISDVATTGGHIQKAAKIFKDSCWKASTPFAIILLNRGGKTIIDDLIEVGIELVSNEVIAGLFTERVSTIEKKAA